MAKLRIIYIPITKILKSNYSWITGKEFWKNKWQEE